MKTRAPSREEGFSRADLLTSLGVVAVLGLVLTATTGATRSGADAVRCLSGQRQLVRAAVMYCADHRGQFPLNGGVDEVVSDALQQRFSQWANNVMTWSATSSWMDQSNTNRTLLERGPLAPYLDDLRSAFKCPADRYLSAMQRARGWTERVRSRSMNGFLGRFSLADGMSLESPPRNWAVQTHRQFLRLTDLPKPAMNFVFIDEHPDSINDGYFLNTPSFVPTQWGDIPASFHDGGAGLSYADGRAEIHRWRSPRTAVPVRYSYTSWPLDLPGRQDFQWYAERVPFVPVR